MAKVSCITDKMNITINNDTLPIDQDILGLIKVASVNDPITKTSYFWLGAISKWRYVMARDIPSEEHTKRD